MTHRYSSGLYFQASYVFSKNIGNAGGFLGGTASDVGVLFPTDAYQRFITDRFNTRLDRGVLAGSREQRFLLTAIYQLPFGKGQKFASGMNSFANGILGGWEISTITMLAERAVLDSENQRELRSIEHKRV